MNLWDRGYNGYPPIPENYFSDAVILVKNTDILILISKNILDMVFNLIYVERLQ